MPETVVLLHGFAGTGRGWDAVVERLDAQRYRALAPDLRGHGAARDLRPISFEACVADVLARGAAPLRPVRLLDGRADRPARRARGPGARPAARARGEHRGHRRRAASASSAERADATLAAEIESGGIDAFADRWLGQPLFASDPPEAQRLAREDIARNDPAALAAALRAVGTGAMAPLWGRLGELAMPAAVLAGERDAKFRALGERLAAGLPQGRLVVVAGAGHALPREAPGAVAAEIQF